MGDLTIKRLPSTIYDTPWQHSLRQRSEKWKYILTNELYTDIDLHIGQTQEIIRSHKIILVLNSPVFESMLSPRWSASDSLILPEDDPAIFKLLLSCFYTDELANQPIDDLLALLLLAKKYLALTVTSKCVNLLKTALSETNAVSIYEAVKLAGENELEKAAETFILSKATIIAGLGELSKLSAESLCHFLSLDDLNIDEVELFNAVYKWGKAEAERSESDLNTVMENILPLIRFPLMSAEEFSTQVVSKEILPLSETVQVYKFLTTPEDVSEKTSAPEVKFNTHPRSRKIFSYVFKRLKGHGFDFGRKWQNLCFQVNHDIKLVSVGLYRGVDPQVELEVGVKIQDFEMTQILGEIEEKLTCSIDADVFHVRFSKPIPIVKDTAYTISYIVKGIETFYKVGEPKRMDLLCSSTPLSFIFREAKEDSDMDQVPELCFQM